jgi:hypothetical protein
MVDLLGAETGVAIDRAELVGRLAAQSHSDPLAGPRIVAAGTRRWTASWLAPTYRGAPLTG